MKRLLMVFVLALMPYSQAKEQENEHLWKPRTTAVTVFKNGFGFFMREGKVKLRDGWCVSSPVPPAAFGTLAIFSGKKNEMVDIIGSGKGEIFEFDGHDVSDTEESRRKRLASCLNLNLQISYTHKGKERKASGKLFFVSPTFAVLESSDNSFAVPVKEIEKIQVLELPLRIHVKSEDSKKLNRESTLGMAYLRKGITWIPEYSLKITSEDEVELTLRGTLVNEAEDLIHCDVNFVVGVPHFVHADHLAPIAIGQVIRTIGSTTAPATFQNQIMNRAAIFSNSSPTIPEFGQADNKRSLKDSLGNLPQLEGTTASDYTVYKKANLTIRRGEKAIVTLFRRKIKFSHLYRWDGSTGIRHFLALHNSTDTSWTTGPCLGMSGNRALTEDTLYYTPKNGTANLEVTAAINIANERKESEIDRKLKAYNPRHNVYYDLVKLEGKISLKNFEKRDVDLIINTLINGKPLIVSDDGKANIDSTKLRLLERSGSVSWRVKLKPGESKKLTYQYERYVPSN